MKHTQAKVAYNSHTQVIWADIERNGNNPRICKVTQHDMSLDEMDANAALICEAFNIASETGKTPAQLAETNRELLAALIEINQWVTVNYPQHGCAHEFGTCASFNAVRSAIRKHS